MSMQTTGTFPQLNAGQRQTVALPAPLKRKPRPAMAAPQNPNALAALQQLASNALRRP